MKEANSCSDALRQSGVDVLWTTIIKLISCSDAYDLVWWYHRTNVFFHEFMVNFMRKIGFSKFHFLGQGTTTSVRTNRNE